MRLTADQVEEKEDSFYVQFLDMALLYAKGDKKADGVQFRQVVAAAGVMAKQRQTRGAMRAVDIGEAFWQDVDTPEMLERAAHLIAEERMPAGALKN